MTQNVSKNSSEKPLLGAVICCTSIVPEERSVLAEYAEQMGAEHKLDLTADVTHLLVGSTNTPKYQYVAREREEVKVLRPDWVQAVRQRWMEDRALDTHALDAEYRMPTFASLKICITGFDNLSVRAEIASAVRQHGGEYTGDLTKDVTHLIAAEPVGKKFEYATIWQKKIVSMKWFSESIERGMQLDESKYHPSLPHEDQGAGAWNRHRSNEWTNRKRAQDNPPVAEPARKLRRTASSKLSSQNDTIWGEIVGADQSTNEHPDVLRHSKSMPVMGRGDNQGSTNKNNNARDTNSAFQATRSDKCLHGLSFYLEGFDNKKQSIVFTAVTGLGAQVHEALSDLLNSDQVQPDQAFIMVPHQFRRSNLPSLDSSSTTPTVVTELWLEKCMNEKAFVPPHHYPLGRLVSETREPEVASFTINATGFSSIETLHISKVVAAIGAHYEQMFTPQCSVLVCRSGVLNQSKMFHGRQWNVTAVTEQWLWELLRRGKVPPFDRYLVQAEPDSDNDLHRQFKQNRKNAQAHEDNKNMITSDKDHGKHREQAQTTEQWDREDAKKPKRQTHADAGSEHYATNGALKEISPNSPIKKPVAKVSSLGKGQHQSLDGSSDVRARSEGASVGEAEKSAKTAMDAEEESVHSAIRELLNVKAKAKLAQQNADLTSNGSKKKRILGRALSNLSNSSRASNTRISRASSIDSLNTDGVGSELAPPSANSRMEDDHATNRGPGVSLLGRAQSKSKVPSQNEISQSIDLSDPNLCRDEFKDTEVAPQMTQLGYEDSEEAIALRAKLTEKRRTKAQAQHVNRELKIGDWGNEVPKKRVIKDDETILALEGQSGWGGGRRTRRKEKDLTDEMF